MNDVDTMIVRWIATGQQRGRPSCPCGFVGGSRNIRKHRMACDVWSHYCRYAPADDRRAALPQSPTQEGEK